MTKQDKINFFYQIPYKIEVWTIDVHIQAFCKDGHTTGEMLIFTLILDMNITRQLGWKQYDHSLYTTHGHCRHCGDTKISQLTIPDPNVIGVCEEDPMSRGFYPQTCGRMRSSTIRFYGEQVQGEVHKQKLLASHKPEIGWNTGDRVQQLGGVKSLVVLSCVRVKQIIVPLISLPCCCLLVVVLQPRKEFFCRSQCMGIGLSCLLRSAPVRCPCQCTVASEPYSADSLVKLPWELFILTVITGVN